MVEIGSGGELPLKAGAVVCNVETLGNIARAIEEGRPAWIRQRPYLRRPFEGGPHGSRVL